MSTVQNDNEFGPDLHEAQGWRPATPGDTVIGTIVEADAGWSDWMNDREGGSYPIITVQEDDGKAVSVHCFQTVLYRRVMSLRPQLGERIKFIYHGKKERSDKTTVAQFTVRVAGRTQTDVYERLTSRRSIPRSRASAHVQEAPEEGGSGESPEASF
jgi:hypothetical protein